MIEVYRIFSRDFEDGLLFDDDMRYEMYQAESSGGQCHPRNGFYHGKKFMDVSVKMWREDMSKGTLFLCELYDDPLLPHWWLDKIFGRSGPPL